MSGFSYLYINRKQVLLSLFKLQLMETHHFSNLLLKKLHQKELFSQEQLDEVAIYQRKNIFSLRSELLLLVYFAVISFTSGIGIMVYINIDSIGHIAIISLNLILMLICFYFAFKNAKGYHNSEVFFENPLYDYVVLTGSLLACIFLGYANYQFALFDESYAYVSLLSAVVCFGVAYYFDNRIVLSMAITSLTAFIGISITPQSMLDNEIYSSLNLTYSGLILGILLLGWMEYSLKEKIKAHFHFVFASFAVHLTGLCLLSGLLSDYWFVFIPIVAGFTYYFYKLSHRIYATSIFAFMLLYSYFGFNIIGGQLLELLPFDSFYELIFVLAPFYVIASIFMFIKLVRKFNKEKDASI